MKKKEFKREIKPEPKFKKEVIPEPKGFVEEPKPVVAPVVVPTNTPKDLPYQTTNFKEAEELSRRFPIKEVISPDEGKGVKTTTYVFYATEKEIRGG